MNEEIVVAVYDTAEHADAAVRDLEAAGFPESAIGRRTSLETGAGEGVTRERSEPGFWASLFGFEGGSETATYDRSVAEGSTVVTVRVPQERAETVMSVLDRHHPVDIDERTASYGGLSGESLSGESMSPAPDVLRTSETRTDLLASDAGAAFGASPSGLPEASASTGAAVPAPDEVRAADVGRETGDVGRATGEERIPLAEEQLRVGKRLVNRGTTRVRRFVVETPVEENVSLRSETATIERRPVVGVAPVADADFSEKVVEVTETEEMPVVEKTARVNEEVVVRKDVKDRTETVRDTTRREDVEIDRPGESASERAREASQGATTEAPRPDVRP